MRKYIFLLSFLVALSSCTIDYKDENTTASASNVPGKITLDVRVDGEMISTRSSASDGENKVESYSLYVFDVITGFLQYKKEDIKPTMTTPVEGTKQIKIDQQEINLPNSGSKYIYAVANKGTSLLLPVMISITEDPSNPTILNEFKSSARVQHYEAPKLPLAMTGDIYLATSVNMKAHVTLERKNLKIQVRKKDDRITLKTMQVKNATKTFFPYASSGKMVGVVNYNPVPAQEGENAATLYMLPSPANQTVITAEATVNDAPVTLDTPLPDDTYSDYDYKLDYELNGKGELTATLYPSYGSGGSTDPIRLSGEWMTGDKETTLPYVPEPNYGFMINYELQVPGTPSVKINDDADWYDVTIINDTQIRIRTLKENILKERASSFTMSCGSDASIKVTVKQQGVQDIKTVTFNGLEWMDRNVGAVYRANVSNCANVLAYGYMYQWGRNVPFPPCGNVETTDSQMTPADAAASSKFIACQNGTFDWNSNGISGTTLDMWDSVSGNPCPEGWRLPTYAEIEEILPYRLNSLIFASGKQSRSNFRPDREDKLVYLGYGSGAISEYKSVNAIYGIMNYGSDDAYYIRWMITNEGGIMIPDSQYTPPVNYISDGTNVVKISRIKADASADYASQKAAMEFWDTHTAEEEIFFPSAGRRDSDGGLKELGNAALYWTGSMYTNPNSNMKDKYCSGMFYFRPAGKYMIMPVPAFGSAQVYYDTENYARRSQAMPIRCVKVK